jgi:hypothetical protein
LTPGTVIARAEAHTESTLLNVEDVNGGKSETDWRETLDLSGLQTDQEKVVRELLE